VHRVLGPDRHEEIGEPGVPSKDRLVLPESPIDAARVVGVAFRFPAMRKLEVLDGIRRAMDRVPLILLAERGADGAWC